MTKPGEPAARALKRCPECGVELKPGLKYCDFCGRKVAIEDAAASDAKGFRAWALRPTAVGTLKAVAAGCLVAGILAVAAHRHRAQETAPVSPPDIPESKRQASATCESAIRQQVRAPFRVIAFRSALVAKEKAGYAVSGSVELQSMAGEVQLKRYFCRVHPDARTGMVLDEGKLD